MNNNLLEFLNKYTAVPQKFITEYYAFYEMCDGKHFGIELNYVIKYLQIKKLEKFYQNFINKYILNVDYVKYSIDNQRRKKNKQYIYYYITLDTFERICMMSKAKKAEPVRDYFIMLRKFIQYYKNHIAKMIMDNNLQQPKGQIYIILANKHKNIFKIGKTDDIRSRLRNYATGKDVHPDIKFIMLVDDKDVVENCVKDLIKSHQYKLGQEIYKVDIDVIKAAVFDCANLNVKYNEITKNKNMDAYVIFDDSEVDNIKPQKAHTQSKKNSKQSKKITKQSKKITKQSKKKTNLSKKNTQFKKTKSSKNTISKKKTK